MIRRIPTLALLVAVVGFSALAAPARDDKPLDAHAVMAMANKPGGPYFRVVRELKQKDPDWDDVQQDCMELTRLAKALGQTKPAQGDADSWKTLTKAYVDTAVTLDKATQAKNLTAARSAIARMNDSCMPCHKIHRKD